MYSIKNLLRLLLTAIALSHSTSFAKTIHCRSLFVTESLYKEVIAIPVASTSVLSSLVKDRFTNCVHETLSEITIPTTYKTNSMEIMPSRSYEPIIEEIDPVFIDLEEELFFEKELDCEIPCKGFCNHLFSFKELLSDTSNNDIDLLYEHGFVFLSCFLEQLHWE